jgi:hypothetical protein
MGINLGLFLDVLDLRVCWGQMWGQFWGCFWIKIETNFGIDLDVTDLKNVLKPSLGLTLGEISLG